MWNGHSVPSRPPAAPPSRHLPECASIPRDGDSGRQTVGEGILVGGLEYSQRFLCAVCRHTPPPPPPPPSITAHQPTHPGAIEVRSRCHQKWAPLSRLRAAAAFAPRPAAPPLVPSDAAGSTALARALAALATRPAAAPARTASAEEERADEVSTAAPGAVGAAEGAARGAAVQGAATASAVCVGIEPLDPADTAAGPVMNVRPVSQSFQSFYPAAYPCTPLISRILDADGESCV
jgi:hypothetical protein